MILFKEKLKELRVYHNLSQKELAEKLEVSQRSIRQPDFETLEKISKFFNVTTDYLLGISE